MSRDESFGSTGLSADHGTLPGYMDDELSQPGKAWEQGCLYSKDSRCRDMMDSFNIFLPQLLCGLRF